MPCKGPEREGYGVKWNREKGALQKGTGQANVPCDSTGQM